MGNSFSLGSITSCCDASGEDKPFESELAALAGLPLLSLPHGELSVADIKARHHPYMPSMAVALSPGRSSLLNARFIHARRVVHPWAAEAHSGA
jgi:hypothetical protein